MIERHVTTLQLNPDGGGKQTGAWDRTDATLNLAYSVEICVCQITATLSAGFQSHFIPTEAFGHEERLEMFNSVSL